MLRASYAPCQSLIDSITRSVIRVTVSFGTLAPYSSARWAELSPCVRPFAGSEHTMASTGPLAFAGSLTHLEIPVRQLPRGWYAHMA